MKRRYMISWAYQGSIGREVWVMNRKGKISSADIKFLEEDIAKRCGPISAKYVIITNVVQIN